MVTENKNDPNALCVTFSHNLLPIAKTLGVYGRGYSPCRPHHRSASGTGLGKPQSSNFLHLRRYPAITSKIEHRNRMRIYLTEMAFNPKVTFRFT